MAGEPDKTVKLWLKRVRAAEKAREQWETRYEVVRCREYWCGIQRDDDTDQGGDRKAVVNRIMPTLRTRIPSLYFYYPYARVVASPAKSDTRGETIDDKAQLIQDTANSLLRDPRAGLKEQTLLALKEAHWASTQVHVAGKTHCHPHSLPALGYFRTRAPGSSTHPAPGLQTPLMLCADPIDVGRQVAADGGW